MKLRALGIGLALAFAVLVATRPVSAAEGETRTLAHHTPAFVSTAKDLGPERASMQVTIHVWLQLHNEEGLRALVQQQYDESSANYHAWLTRDEFNAQFAPSTKDVGTIKSFLAAHNLSVISVGERNLYVKAQGTIADVQRAFNVQIHRYNVRGEIHRANTSDPTIEGPAGAIISRLGGLSDLGYQPHSVRPINLATGEPSQPTPLSAMPNGAFFSANCFRPPQTVNFSTDGSLPKATYFGNRYGSDITNNSAGTLPPCGYQPSEVQTAYNLNEVYNAGLTGTGQTVVIVDAFGSPSIETDAAVFSGFYGLGPLNLTVYQPGGPPATQNAGWATETSLDVEWAHSVAPGAAIALIEAPTNSFDDLDAAILFAVDNELGNVISNSYGAPEVELGGVPFTPLDDLLLTAASQGISVNYSSGDNGDFFLVEGQTDVSYPASSPYATGVGGTSLALRKDGSMAFQTGWGNNETRIANITDASGFNTPVIPPLEFGFIYGAGGGTSAVYPMPHYQRSGGLHGKFRLVPDISYLADPYTGVEFFCAGSSCFGIPDPSIYFSTVGGTSLACPMFSGMWAIANERAGHPLGLAAASVYNLPFGAVTDVIPPFFSPFNVFGFITTTTGTTFESPNALIAPGNHSPYFSALYNGTSTRWYALSFGTDSSLHTDFGWDNVTGVGTPNGLRFVNAVAHRH
jgi:subtilase family serine protease